MRYEPSQVRGEVSLALASAINHAGGAVELTCAEHEADVDVYDATLSAMKVATPG